MTPASRGSTVGDVDTTPDPDTLILRHEGGHSVATFEGRTFTFGGSAFETVESLMASALWHQERARREAAAARFALALAHRMERDQAEEAARKAGQRKARAAATRARRADPFGFEAAKKARDEG